AGNIHGWLSEYNTSMDIINPLSINLNIHAGVFVRADWSRTLRLNFIMNRNYFTLPYEAIQSWYSNAAGRDEVFQSVATFVGPGGALYSDIKNKAEIMSLEKEDIASQLLVMPDLKPSISEIVRASHFYVKDTHDVGSLY